MSPDLQDATFVQATAAMTTLPSICLLLLLLGGLARGRTLLLDTCSVEAHVHEMRKHYSSVRASAVSCDAGT